MKSIGLLLFISGLTLNDASTYCYDALSSSSGYNTAISDDYVYCYGFGACKLASISATADVSCNGYMACSNSEQIKTSGGAIYCDGNYGCYSADAITSNSYLNCDGEFGCYGSGDLSGNYIYCSGDYGCAYVSGDITAESRVYCDGKYGCYRVEDGTISGDYVEATGVWSAYYSNIDATYDVTCGGKYSCYYATINSGDDVFIEAKYAAFRATITAKDIVYCDAEYGCYYSTIKSDSYVYVDANNGAYAADITAKRVLGYASHCLYNADITSIDDEDLYVYLFGYNAGYFANIYCSDSSNCYIYCYGDTACKSLEIYYYGELSNIEVYPNDCKSYSGSQNDDGVYCPSFTSSTSITMEEFQTKRKELVEASDDFEELMNNAEEKRVKGDKARQKAEKTAKEQTIKAEKETNQENNKSNKIFANFNGLLQNEASAIFNVSSFYALIFGAVFTFIMMHCYYTKYKNRDDKYQPLLS